MSKGNLLFGQARGKVGDLVLTRLAGEQVARARNRAPKNPRTTKQMVQRAMMATLVEFYTRGTRNLFKFAFESKRPGESDYNAFVRANMGRVPVQSKKTIANDGYIGGDFVMTQGSLPAPAFAFDETFIMGAFRVPAIGVTGAELTIGKLSSLIIEKNDLQDGDIITIVGICGTNGGSVTDIAEAKAAGELNIDVEGVKWVIKQFKLDTTSTALVSTLGIFNVTSLAADSVAVPLLTGAFATSSFDDGEPVMLCAIASRVVAGRVLVSTSSTMCSKYLQDANTIGMSDEWKTWVAKHYMESTSFNAKPEDILKGSISKN